jgi:hypothetical protein
VAAKVHSAAKPQAKELRTAESASWKQRNDTRRLSGPRLLKIFDNLRDSDGVQCKERKDFGSSGECCQNQSEEPDLNSVPLTIISLTNKASDTNGTIYNESTPAPTPW